MELQPLKKTDPDYVQSIISHDFKPYLAALLNISTRVTKNPEKQTKDFLLKLVTEIKKKATSLNLLVDNILAACQSYDNCAGMTNLTEIVNFNRELMAEEYENKCVRLYTVVNTDICVKANNLDISAVLRNILGRQLITSMVEQLRGTYTFHKMMGLDMSIYIVCILFAAIYGAWIGSLWIYM